MSIFRKLASLGRRDLAIDLGTANTVVYAGGDGVVVNQPSIVAIDNSNGLRRIIAVGEEAKRMLGRSPDGISVIRPMRDGVVADIEVAEEMLKHFIKLALSDQARLRQPNVVVCVPSGATSVERRAIRDATLNAGAAQVRLITEPLAAALGAGIVMEKPEGAMVVDIGGGTTEVGVLSMGGLVSSVSLRYGGDKLDEAITNYVRRQHNLLIGEATAERIKIAYGSAIPPPDGEGARFVVRGLNVVTGVPSTIELCEAELNEAMSEVVSAIAEGVRNALESTPPELAADIYTNGIVLTGGGALLLGLDLLIADSTGLRVERARDPLLCVANGTRMTLEDPACEAILSQA